ncbi:MAG: DUF5069 domain-containing protein [Verrucomicrobia bacterium]|nr:DUF5069 domain-containing protein [Verrucomicrobiota bacterium]
MNAPDLTQRPPRSARVRLGGFVILPRILDKCRAVLAGTNGAYHYACPLDQRFFGFTGVDPEALKAEVAKGLGDRELLEWVRANSPAKRTDWEIDQWSRFRETAAPGDNASRGYVSGEIEKAGGAERDDLGTWFEWLDFDDYVSFGGQG